MKYLITKYRGDGIDVKAHHKHCEANQIPCIYALARRTRCLLICEFEHIEGAKKQVLVSNALETKKFFESLGSRYPKPASISGSGNGWYYFSDLLISDAEQVAEETYDYLTAIMNRAANA
ncbi:hypothetical protein K3722_04170 [Leisingera caerulea]|uniref:Uncharacterized protein n=1 Tax=Leisingera caerulea TaxID=506591 RepID=A0ABY5WYC9_LEICA|nr:hypothetical protein [Leisingera caerulea]UWQ59331.1 hypothetical protein K3722_04170 [Leisingera caerulea]